MRSKALFGPVKCGCSFLEMVLGVSCEGGTKKTSETYKKRKFKENTILGTKQHIRMRCLGPENVDIARQRWRWVQHVRVARKN